MSDNISFELQVEIIKRLPVKSLAVFRSVSKAWKSMIDSPLFISNYSNLRQHHRILIRYDTDFISGDVYKYVSITDDDTLSRHTVSNVPLSFQLPNELQLVGTSQGLFCLFDISPEDDYDKETAVMWNPSLGKSIAIDVPCHASVLGFGVRPDNFDPMIVSINDFRHRQPDQVMVFTLSSRAWRVPRGNIPPEIIDFAFSSPVATDDRCIYWISCKCDIYLVLAFDMVSEDFKEINLPHSVAHRSYDDFSISKMKESLALLEYCYDAEKPVYGVWKMVEDGVSKLFTKLFTIIIPDAKLQTKVLGFRKNGQPIMETKIDWVSASVGAYEPRTGTIKNLGINGEFGSFFCCSYTESLILLDQLDEQVVKVQLR